VRAVIYRVDEKAAAGVLRTSLAAGRQTIRQIQFRKPNYRRLGSSSHSQCGFRHSGFKPIAEARPSRNAAAIGMLGQYPDAGVRAPNPPLKIAAQTERGAKR
jgi:hypothetical protein